ncbi:MAG: riboflavin synthase [Candidatus Omnitrophica bacterium]|nr:riboflavin synthase [Candidatus Omnitrophota bacterium]
MFTGIIKEIGRVHEISRAGNLYKLAIQSKDIFKSVNIGDSVSVNGACLTVKEKKGDILSFDVVDETIRKTNLKTLKTKNLVNLEDSLKAGEPFSGHFVLGHIDCVGEIKDARRIGDDIAMDIAIPEEFIDLIVEKGSIAIDGISLTIGRIRENRFNVYLIPHTLEATTLGLKRRGDGLNIEFDIIGKYIARSSGLEKDDKITEEFLKAKGF